MDAASSDNTGQTFNLDRTASCEGFPCTSLKKVPIASYDGGSATRSCLRVTEKPYSIFNSLARSLALRW